MMIWSTAPEVVEGDHVARSHVFAADGVIGRVEYRHAVARIAKIAPPREIGSDLVALNLVSLGLKTKNTHAIAKVARNQVSLTSASNDGVGGPADADAVATV